MALSSAAIAIARQTKASATRSPCRGCGGFIPQINTARSRWVHSATERGRKIPFRGWEIARGCVPREQENRRLHFGALVISARTRREGEGRRALSARRENVFVFVEISGVRYGYFWVTACTRYFRQKSSLLCSRYRILPVTTDHSGSGSPIHERENRVPRVYPFRISHPVVLFRFLLIHSGWVADFCI